MHDREHTECLIAKLLRKRKDKFEALSWLKASTDKSKRNLAEFTPKQSIKWIQQLYARGATEVWAVRIGRNPPYESIDTLIVTLPDDPGARLAVFRWTNAQAMSDGFDPDEDYGQRHLYVWFD